MGKINRIFVMIFTAINILMILLFYYHISSISSRLLIRSGKLILDYSFLSGAISSVITIWSIIKLIKNKTRTARVFNLTILALNIMYLIFLPWIIGSNF